MRVDKSRIYIRRSILGKTTVISWLITIITLGIYVLADLPAQKNTFIDNMRSKARGVSASLQDIAASAVITEEYSEVIDHCLEVLSGDPGIEYLILTRSDGFSLIHTRSSWKNETLGSEWIPHDRKPVFGINYHDFINKEVFSYSQPFGYSGINWGWIHIGLSLDRSSCA